MMKISFLSSQHGLLTSKSRDCQGSDPRTLDLNDSRGIRQSTLDPIYHVIVRVSTRINYPHSGSSAAAGSLLRLEINQIPQIRGSLQLADGENLTGTRGLQGTWKA